MSQPCVEQVIGRLATDLNLRRNFAVRPEEALQELAAEGMRLTRVETQALLLLDLEALERLADRLDPRIQRVSLDRNHP